MSDRATKERTHSFTSSKNIVDDKKRNFGDLSISALGIGTFLGSADDQTDQMYFDAIRKVLVSGVNLIDSAINYRRQRSEKIIGKALLSLEKEKITKEQIVISTKGGFLSCEDDPRHFFDSIRKRYIETKIIEEKDIVEDSHCISPSFISAEIDHSLKNLNLECIDLYYLHNPEIQLFSMPEAHFYEKLKAVFTLLEQKVEEKKIGSYGLATWNGFRQKKGSRGYLDLGRILEIAESINKNHHLSCIQIPFNLIMLEIVKLPNQILLEKTVPFLRIAQEKHIDVIVSAPLMQSYVKNLPQRVFDNLPGEGTCVQKALQFILSTKGVTAALLGMKNPIHIKENLEVLTMPDWDADEMKIAHKFLGI